MNLSPNEILLHIDFSENYALKYYSEVQAAHFGASKKQLSLHTGVLYFKENTKDLDENAEADDGTKNLSFCTVPENLEHGAHAVWAHLKPILEELVPNNVSSKVDSVHFWSDGLSSQYKNCLNFFYLTELLPILCPSIKRSTWNFSTAGHGKGAMDGVGGALKRMADTLVARGIADITDSDSFLQNLKKTERTVKLYKIENTDIANLKEKSKDIPQIPNIMQKHQIIWNIIEKKKITTQDLSCFSGIQEDVCSHFMTKKRHVLMNNRFSDTESDSDNPPANAIKNIAQNDYVVIKLAGKKSVRFYVGVIISQDARKCREDKFTFPEQDDIAEVDLSDIVDVLSQPS
ncbi:hypothetical protein AVEN_115746-1 [Araneus ventricosus]|uniref:Uncharacterized protein n=1 Tax=Araneus ventricosus TaxID=182803 RepID=A0A4Y2LLD8_ARAVE|nr:hypothetical protein AVEN_115746-1 [Araneus ventricosus]